MEKAQEKVSNWMRNFGQDVPEKLTIPSPEVRILRAKLILEEALETILDGLGVGGFSSEDRNNLSFMLEDLRHGRLRFFTHGKGPDINAIADGISDLQVVTLGTAVACGIPAQACFDEVMRSNDSKMWTDEEVHARSSGDLEAILETEIGERWSIGASFDLTAVRVADNGRCWLVKDTSGKVIKSPSYSPANLKAVLEKQQ